jgi:hypothetical protein
MILDEDLTPYNDTYLPFRYFLDREIQYTMPAAFLLRTTLHSIKCPNRPIGGLIWAGALNMSTWIPSRLPWHASVSHHREVVSHIPRIRAPRALLSLHVAVVGANHGK